MPSFISVSNHRMAQAFVDYMATLGVTVELVVSHNEVRLELKDDTKLSLLETEWQRFLDEPNHKRYLQASWQTGSVNSGIKYSHNESYWQTIRDNSGPVTLSILALSLFVYILMFFWGSMPVLQWLSFPRESQQAFQLWRWVTPAFMHFSFMHLSFNLVMWWYFGGKVELSQSSVRLFNLTLLAAILSNLAQSLVSDAYFGGLSGVVYALVGYVWIYSERKPQEGIHLARPMMAAMLIWLVLGYFNVVSAIANTAHLAGLVVGVVVGWWVTRHNN